MNKKSIITVIIALVSIMTAKAQISGDWKGTLDVQGMQLEIIFHINETDGGYSSTMDVPLQGATGLATDQTTFVEQQLTISFTQLGITYTGVYENNAITGSFKQSGMEFPLTLTKFVSKLPGNTALPSTEEELIALAALDKGNYKYKVEDYFAKPAASEFQLSPNGKYMSYREKDNNNKRHIYVKEIATGKSQRIVEEKEELIRGYGWINDERLVFVMDKGGNENYHIFAANLDGSNMLDLTPFDDVRANILNMLKDQKDYIIISMNKNNKQVFDPYKLNILTGELEQLFENTDLENPVQDYDFDKDGELRAYTRLVNGLETHLYYKNLATGEFRLFKKMRWDDSFGIIGFNYSGNKDELYVVTNLDSDKARIVLYDFNNDKMIKEVFSNRDYDASNMARSRKRNYEIDYFAYEGEKYTIIPVSDFYKDFHQQMKKQFPNKQFYITGYDDNETTFLILVTSDKHYGTYYQYDTKTKKFTLLYDLMPQLKEADMAELRPITFKSRDGLTIHGYIALPKAALEGKKVPLIVHPHGGPSGRDSWGFNPETQLFASRGYATLQVNFRVSSGYGKKFLRAGLKQVGRKIMDDIEDGVQYVLERGWVDPDKIAIYGGSHGGFATLMGLIKTPDLYTCGVNYVGVSNWFTFFNAIPEYWKPMRDMLKEIFYDVDDPVEAEIARAVSPAFHVEKIGKPLFVVQGANDPRVNIDESDQIVIQLREKGITVPYMVKYNEGHGFAHEENTMELYKAMMGFFSKYLKD
jgi:dipeptidyl aminopeptidase/acylaminoacyl peptidase